MKREAGYLIRQAADSYGEATAVTCGTVNRTFSEQNRVAESVASALHRQGIRTGDQVGILGWNSLALLDAWFGCEKLGAVRVVLHPHLSDAILREQMESLPLRAVFVDDEFAGRLAEHASHLRTRCKFIIMNGKSSDLGPSFDELLASATGPWNGLQVDDSQPWIIQFTSGTTGRPKPWCKSLRSFIAVVEHNLLVLDRVNRGDAIDQDDVNLHFHTLQSSSGFKGLFPYYIRGARTVLLNPQRAGEPAAELCSAIVAQHASGLLLHGTTFREWLLHLQALPPETRATVTAPLRRVVTSLAGPRLLELASELIGPIWCHTYGSTEQGSPVTALYAHDLTAWGGRGTVGRLQSAADELRIVDAETGQRAATGEPGEIEVRSEMAVGKYVSNDAGRPQADAAGWLRVGDQGMLDNQGALHLLGRSKDTIHIGAWALHPWQIERRLLDLFPLAHCAVIRNSSDYPSVYVAVELDTAADESIVPHMEQALSETMPSGISWGLRIVPAMPTAEGGVKIDRAGVERLLAQTP